MEQKNNQPNQPERSGTIFLTEEDLMNLPSIYDKSVSRLHELVETTRHAIRYMRNPIPDIGEKLAFFKWCDLLTNFLEPIALKFHREALKELSLRIEQEGGAL